MQMVRGRDTVSSSVCSQDSRRFFDAPEGALLRGMVSKCTASVGPIQIKTTAFKSGGRFENEKDNASAASKVCLFGSSDGNTEKSTERNISQLVVLKTQVWRD